MTLLQLHSLCAMTWTDRLLMLGLQATFREAVLQLPIWHEAVLQLPMGVKSALQLPTLLQSTLRCGGIVGRDDILMQR